MRSVMHQKKHLSFDGLIKTASQRFEKISDYRQQSKLRYSIHDCYMSALAMMFLQDSSVLEFQRRMKEEISKCNLESMFHITDIPEDTQFRDIFDNADYSEAENVFSDFFRSLQRGKQLERFQFLDGHYLVTLDGSGYFSSYKIECPGCLTKETTKDGEKTIRYEHQILQPAIVCPGQKQVIPLVPEQIRNTDGTKKQDCETKAGKRAIERIRKDHPKLKIIITADSLYSKQPFIDKLKENRMSYIIVAKPTDHKVLFEWVEDFKKLGACTHWEVKDIKGFRHVFDWCNEIPLNGTKDAENVNFMEYSEFNKSGERTYHNTWVTDFTVSKKNVAQLVKGGRTKWKIENETFNTLKNQGYHIEHNYGHGKKNLSYVFFLMNLLAFFMHQIFALTDFLYEKCRNKFSAKKEYWNQLRCTFRVFFLTSWVELLKFIIKPDT